MESGRLTVKEIARLAGVSIGTVDRVLHDRGGVSAPTKERIDAIVASLGYSPNIIARQLSLNKTWVFRVVMPRAEQDSGYWSLCLDGILRAERDLAAYGASIKLDEFDRYDRAAYRALLEEIAEDPGDGLLIAPVLPDELRPALCRIDGRVPYAFFDGSVEGARPLAVVGQDAFAGGYLAGRMLSLVAGKGEGRFVALNAHAEDRHIKLRIEGCLAYFRERAEREARRCDCFELGRAEEAESFLEGLFGGIPRIAGILVANSSGHLVGEWLRRTGRKPGCALVSWDLVPANLRSLREGSVDCLISQRPFEQGREGLERLFRAVVHEDSGGGDVEVPFEVYFKENLPRDELAFIAVAGRPSPIEGMRRPALDKRSAQPISLR
jgi:LacI family transcriptional regulator